MRKMMVVTAMVLAMLCVVPSFCLAAGTWSTANVNSVGVGGDVTYIQLSPADGGTQYAAGTYFTADATRAKEMLATALTAISLSKTCLIWLDDTAPYSFMTSMYLNQ